MWFLVSTGESHKSAKQPRFKTLPLMDPGRGTNQQIFSHPYAPSDLYAMHAHTSWLPELCEQLQTNEKAVKESAGNNRRTTKTIHVHLDEMVIHSVVQSFSNKPNYAIMPISWWEGFAIDDSNVMYEAFVKTEQREQLSAYLYSQVLGPFWAYGFVLHNDNGLAIQFVSRVKMRMGISHAFKKALIEHIADFEKVGINFKEETTRGMLTTMVSDGASSALTATWTTVDTAYIAGGRNPHSKSC